MSRLSCLPVPASRMGAHCAWCAISPTGPQGKVAGVYVEVDPEKNSAQVLAGLKAAR